MNSTRKIVLTGVFCAIAVATSSLFAIPVAGVRALPVQHMINILLAVLVGTRFAVGGAFTISLIRNILGTGTLFAFPGSLVGALLAGLVYKKTKSLALTALAEVIGTGVIGALLSYPLATFVMGREVTMFFIMPAFFASSLVGAVLSFVLLKVMLPRLNFKTKGEVA